MSRVCTMTKLILDAALEEHYQDGFFSLPNESAIWIGGLNDKERIEKILGNEYCTIFFNECSQIPYSSITIARTRLAQVVKGYHQNGTSFVLPQRAYYDLNPVGTKHWSHTEFVRKLSPVDGTPLPHPENFAYDTTRRITPRT
jgi:phage terminase large subunit